MITHPTSAAKKEIIIPQLKIPQRAIEPTLQGMNDRAAAIYRPKPYAGRVTLFKPRTNYQYLPDPNMGWEI
jgi:hypothetical protein